MDLKSVEQLIADELAYDDTDYYEGYRVKDLRAVYDTLTDPADWKGPICARMRGEAVLISVAAIAFFCATKCQVSLDPGTMFYLVESDGYRMGQAGDH